MGEPAGIGGELTLKAWKNRVASNLPVFFAIDDPARLQAIDPEIPIKEIVAPQEALSYFDSALPVLPLALSQRAEAGILNPVNGQAVLDSIRKAVSFCLEGQVAGLVTNPIHKAVLYDIGFNHPGHTEFIAHLCGKNETPVMMLAAKDLRVVPLTVHIPLKEVPSQISQEMIIEKAKIIDRALRQDFGLETPRIAVAGLNPHAGEGGTIGTEDGDIITPAIQALQEEGMTISGPYPADTMFNEEARAGYDIALGMYHDQALIPLKTLDFHGGVNVTLGLSVVRTSPDHGTALNIAGKGVACADSFINALKMAVEIAQNRAA